VVGEPDPVQMDVVEEAAFAVLCFVGFNKMPSAVSSIVTCV
jgi:hypothetical protein